MTKDLVLAILKKENTYVSGEKISIRLGISRAAVNAAVKNLRADGYEILSSTNKGYFLKDSPNRLSIGELAAYLPKERLESVRYFDSVDSTNNRLRDLAFAGVPEGQVVLANEQTNGRGRRGRQFVSPKDKGIYLSLYFCPDSLPSDMVSVTAWAAVAVSNAIASVCKVRPQIKWVNDLLLNGKKICGILTEMSVESESGQIQYVVLGVGLNVNEQPEDFPEEIQEIATSLSAECGQQFSRAALAAEIIKELDWMRSLWPQGKKEYLEAYRTANFTIGKEVIVMQKAAKKDGIAEAVNEDFSLRVRYADGSTENISSGEVQISALY